MANGNSSNLASDMWKEVPAWLKATLQLGAPTVAAGWLIYVLSTTLSGNVLDIKAEMQQHILTTETMIQKINERDNTRDLKLDILIRVMQTQCVNAATDVLQRRDCLNAGGK